MEIHNIRGQKIRNLVDGFKVAGMHIVVWDGRDSYGRRVTIGCSVLYYKDIQRIGYAKNVSFRAIRMNLKKT